MNNQSRQALLGGDANTAHYKSWQEPEDKALEFELREHAGHQVTAQDQQVHLAQKNVSQAGNFWEVHQTGRPQEAGRPTTLLG